LNIRLFWNRGRPVLLWFWLGGAALVALVAATRIVRFERLLRDTLPASERLQRLACEIAGNLGVRRVPDVRYVECVEVPFLWCAGHRATIVLPMRLSCQLDEQSSALILAHELAHLRRRDHWVRAVELIVSTVYPMSCRGWPHVSFYPADDGGDFGGNYFGTGDSVLKRWWGSEGTDRKATTAPTCTSSFEDANDRNTQPVPARFDRE